LSERSTSVVDANAIIALLLGGRRTDSERARIFFESIREGTSEAYLPSAVLAECVYVLTRIYKVTRADAASKLLALLDYRGALSEPGARRTLELYRDHNVDFVDALVVAIARERGFQVFSADRDLEKLMK
jgi:predicted nucleic acid-binding protein